MSSVILNADNGKYYGFTEETVHLSRIGAFENRGSCRDKLYIATDRQMEPRQYLRIGLPINSHTSCIVAAIGCAIGLSPLCLSPTWSIPFILCSAMGGVGCFAAVETHAKSNSYPVEAKIRKYVQEHGWGNFNQLE